MKVFTHHIYEYKKGLRNLVLHTMPANELDNARRKLEHNSIDYEMYVLDSGNVNIFFGARECVRVIRSIGKRLLSSYTPEEDFILGTMLGYDRLLQCRRYLRFLDNQQAFIPPRGRMDAPEEISLSENQPEPCRGDGVCTGCINGNPCPACQERIERAG